jgi:hypothetical protein
MTMKLKEYIAHLNKIAESNPKALNMEVVTASDDEGNCFRRVSYLPSVGLFKGTDFTSKDEFKYMGIKAKSENAICLN